MAAFRTALLALFSVVVFISVVPHDSYALAAGSTAAGFYGQVGAYGVQSPDQLGDMAQNGFHLALIPPGMANGRLRNAIDRNRIHYIDTFPWMQIKAICRDDLSNGNSCSPENEVALLDKIQNYVAANKNNSALIGYWVLDDYPGADIRELLRKIHMLLVASGRPAICAFGGSLDSQSWGIGTDFRPGRFRGFMRFLSNFDPEACDMVALYPYATGRVNDHTDVDWTMANTLPRMLSALRARGWDQEKQPLIGMPQTFGGPRGNEPGLYFVVPETSDVAEQAEAYCRAGAIALLAYTWDDGKAGMRSELSNSRALVDGLREGGQRCQQHYWSH